MNILLSAYACEPFKGSEPAVGWNWAQELSKQGHKVYVVTRKNNESNINKYYKHKPKKIKFIYYDLPNLFIKLFSNKGKSNPLSFLYFFFWQIGIYFVIKPYIKKIKFDYIHHVTFVSLRYPSFLCYLNVPFLLGPVAGGDKVPIKLRKKFFLKNKLFEYLRDLINYLIKFSPLHTNMYRNSKKIFYNSNETKELIPKKFYYKSKKMLAISIDENEISKKPQEIKKKINICYVGRLEQLKGIDILIDTFYLIKSKNKNVNFNIVGTGTHDLQIKKKINNLKLGKDIKWKKYMPRIKLLRFYKQNNFLIFPSLRDSGGMVLLEAMSKGTVVAGLNIGGPNEIIDKYTGVKINTKNYSYNDIIKKLSNEILLLINNKKRYKQISKNCLNRVYEFSMKKKINYIYKKYY